MGKRCGQNLRGSRGGDPDGPSGGGPARAFGAENTPYRFIVDRAGRLASQGAVDDGQAVNYVERALEERLSGKPVSTPETPSYGCAIR